MATKNLAHTVVEGGRSGYSKLDRKLRNRNERRMRFDAEDDVVCGKVRRAGGRGFADHLGPLERWLGRHVGRGWSNIYREFCQRFDRRTMKGWHLEDHLLQMVDRGRFPWGASFFVDPRGILRRRPRLRGRWQRGVSPTEEAKALSWAAGRRVILQGDVAFRTARAIDSLVLTSPQGQRLTPDELNVWASLAPELRQKLTYDAEAERRRRTTVDEIRGSMR